MKNVVLIAATIIVVLFAVSLESFAQFQTQPIQKQGTVQSTQVVPAKTKPPKGPHVKALKINNGAPDTRSRKVTLNNTYYTPGGAVSYRASERKDFSGSNWQSYSSAPVFQLSSGDGEKTVYFQIKNKYGKLSNKARDTIILIEGKVLTTKTPKVDNFLKALPTLPNANSARAAFVAAKFSEIERIQLRDALKNQTYSTHITRLSKTIAKQAIPRKRVRQTIASRKAADTQKINAYNQKVKNEAQKIIAVSLAAKLPPGLSGTPPQITTLGSYTEISPGRGIVIQGKNFLPRGDVHFSFGAQYILAEIDTWTEEVIVAVLPSNVQGLPEIQGKVRVRKPINLFAEAPIKFIPRYEYVEITSRSMTSENPWNSEIAFLMFLVMGFNAKWCAVYDIIFSDPESYLLNGWVVDSYVYESDSDITAQEDEEYEFWVGLDVLPPETYGELCQAVWDPKGIDCIVTIKGPKGLNYK